MYRDAYLESEVLSASPVQLVELMYRGALQALSVAIAAVDAGDIASRNQSLTKAQTILTELATSLDHSQGGDLSRQLAELYDYMQRRLGEANFMQQAEPIHEVRKLLAPLAEAWAALGSSAGSSSSLADFDGSSRWSQAAVYQGSGEGLGVDFEHAGVNSLG